MGPVAFAFLEPLVRRALGRGLAAAGVLSPKGRVLAALGALDDDELQAIAAFVSHARPAEFLDRLFVGELVTANVAGREICLGVAGQCVFVVTVFGPHHPAGLHATALFRDEVDWTITMDREAEKSEWVPPDAGPSGSGSAPAEAFAWPPAPGRGGRGAN